MGRRQQRRANVQNKLAPVKELPEEPVLMLRSISAQSCPAHINKSKACVEEFAKEIPQLEKCISAPAVVSPIPHWPGVPGAEIKIRNTFLHVEMAEGDEEMAFLQACRRRNTHSCPFFTSSKEPAPEESPRMPIGTTAFNDILVEPAMEPSPELPVHRKAPFEDAPLSDSSLCKASHEGAPEGFRKLMAWAVEKQHLAPGRRTCADDGLGSVTAATISAFHPYQGLTKDPSFEDPSFDWPPLDRCSGASSIARPAERPLCAQSHVEPELEPGVISHCGSRRIRASRRCGRNRERLWCHVFLDPCMLERGFDLIKKVIGKSGCNTRGIYESTGTKIRVRGKGSGHVEDRIGREAPVPLMIALAAENGADSFSKAFEMIKELLQDVSWRFEAFLKRQGRRAPTGPLFSLGECSEQSFSCLSPAALDGVHVKISRQIC